jgi:predicted HTH transcriptional regulator
MPKLSLILAQPEGRRLEFKASMPEKAELAKTIIAFANDAGGELYSQGSTDYTGVYRNDRWEYPVIAIREVIRNAIIHRDYSLSGKDIKIAIFDDKIEITSPGNLMPSVDFNDMESGQSDIRNITLAPVFKRLGIIEQWGNGLKLIADQLQGYPEIELSWKEPGIAFRVTFGHENYQQSDESQPESLFGIKNINRKAIEYKGIISENGAKGNFRTV